MRTFLLSPAFLLLLAAFTSLYAEELPHPCEKESAIVLACTYSENISEAPGAKGCIAIQVDNLRNSDGILGIALFRTENGFPDEPEKAFAQASIQANEAEGVLILENIPYGNYALSLLHDENENQKMDTTWIGKPKEGFGASNNPKVRFGPPEFDESGFVLDQETITIAINMKYF